MPRRKRLLWQLYPSFLLITLISLVVITWYASTSLKDFFLEKTSMDLEARAHLFEKQILEYLDPLDEKAVDALCKKIGPRASTRITVMLPAGKVIGDSEHDPAAMDNHADRPEFKDAFFQRSGTATRYSRTLGKRMMYVAVPLNIDGQTVAVVRTSTEVSAIDDAITSIQVKIALVGAIMAAFAAALSLFISRRLSRPIEEIKRGAEAIAQGDFDFHLPVSGIEEIAGLSAAMKKMAADLNDRIHTISKQRNELEAVLSSMVEGVIALDPDEMIISMNQAACHMLGCQASEVQGRSVQEAVRNPVMQQFVRDTLSSQFPLEKEILLYADKERTVSAHGTPLYDADKTRIGAVIVLNDVTRLKKLESIRRDFVANVTHEIKTPVTAIKGFVETLADGALDNTHDARRFLGIIDKHVDRLEAIIEDLLSLSRIEQDDESSDIKLVKGRIREVLETAVQLVGNNAAAKDIEISLACNQDLFASFNAPLLEQVVVNLLDNAVKYSEQGSTVGITALQNDEDITISVKDEGCGIEPKHLPRLFERFYRVDKGRSRKLGGTGLGLAIVKHITQAHGGHVTVESTPDQGSTFTVHLPIA